MLIHGLSDGNIPAFHSDEIHAHDPKGIEVWKVPGAVHTGAHSKVVVFFGSRPGQRPHYRSELQLGEDAVAEF
jgi:hypothetical protein